MKNCDTYQTNKKDFAQKIATPQEIERYQKENHALFGPRETKEGVLKPFEAVSMQPAKRYITG